MAAFALGVAAVPPCLAAWWLSWWRWGSAVLSHWEGLTQERRRCQRRTEPVVGAEV